MMQNPKVLVVGSAPESTGGVASVLRLCEKMPMWEKYSCYWLGSQLHGSYYVKIKYALTAWLKALIIIWKYDIVHFHTTPDKLGLLIQLPILLLAKIGRKKTIIHIHVGNQLENHVDNGLFNWWMNRCDMVVLLAKKWQQLLVDKYKNLKTPIRVIYNASESLTPIPFEEREKCIIYVGSLNPNKAPDLLLKAWERIHMKYPDWKVKFCGGSILLEDSKKMAKNMGIDDSVCFMGFCRGNALKEAFSKASIYVMCSYNEGFPMSVLEAWEYGIPVVSTPVGGLPDVIEEGKNCLTFGFGDYEVLANCLSALIEDQNLRRDMSNFSKNFVEDTFSLNIISKDFVDLYDKLNE